MNVIVMFASEMFGNGAADDCNVNPLAGGGAPGAAPRNRRPTIGISMSNEAVWIRLTTLCGTRPMNIVMTMLKPSCDGLSGGKGRLRAVASATVMLPTDEIANGFGFK